MDHRGGMNVSVRKLRSTHAAFVTTGDENLRDEIYALRFGVIVAVLATCNIIGLSLAQAQSAARTDPLLNNGPPVWDTNHDGVFTCDEWKKFMEQLFVSADKGRKGFLTKQEFEAIKKADPSLADADFGYFDENQDSKITRKEFVEKPSVFILRFDRNGDCRVTPDELKAATTPAPTGGPQERPRDRFH
jgi:Ca2+-binding EF-hand superfamily protein